MVAEKLSKIDTIFFDYEGVLTKENMYLKGEIEILMEE